MHIVAGVTRRSNRSEDSSNGLTPTKHKQVGFSFIST